MIIHLLHMSLFYSLGWLFKGIDRISYNTLIKCKDVYISDSEIIFDNGIVVIIIIYRIRILFS